MELTPGLVDKIRAKLHGMPLKEGHAWRIQVAINRMDAPEVEWAAGIPLRLADKPVARLVSVSESFTMPLHVELEVTRDGFAALEEAAAEAGALFTFAWELPPVPLRTLSPPAAAWPMFLGPVLQSLGVTQEGGSFGSAVVCPFGLGEASSFINRGDGRVILEHCCPAAQGAIVAAWPKSAPPLFGGSPLEPLILRPPMVPDVEHGSPEDCMRKFEAKLFSRWPPSPRGVVDADPRAIFDDLMDRARRIDFSDVVPREDVAARAEVERTEQQARDYVNGLIAGMGDITRALLYRTLNLRDGMTLDKAAAILKKAGWAL